MTSERDLEPLPPQLPLAKMWQRMAAGGIDFILAWLLSTVALTDTQWQIGQWLIFSVVWLVIRVPVVINNQGQSPGHWAMDMKVIDANYLRLPRIESLIKREAVAGGASLFLLIGLNSGGYGLLICALPLAIDCGLGIADPIQGQTLHDRVWNTTVIYADRGFSLDLKLQRLLGQARQRMR